MMRAFCLLASLLALEASAGTELVDIGVVRFQWVEAEHWAMNDPHQIAKALRTDTGQKWVLVNADGDLADLDQWILHEFAHHAAWDAYGEDIEEHGPEFRRMCRRFVTRRPGYFCK